jgi:hypothetical protein
MPRIRESRNAPSALTQGIAELLLAKAHDAKPWHPVTARHVATGARNSHASRAALGEVRNRRQSPAGGGEL